MIGRRLAGLLVAGLLAACAPAKRPAAPVPVPAPVTEPASVEPVPATPQAPAVAAPSVISAQEVAREAGAVFGVAPDVSGPAEGDGPTWDIDVRSFAEHTRVAHYVDQFSGPARTRLAARLSRGTRYESMIRAKLRAGGLPEDLFYLALVESGFDPDAYSRAAAVGMWQFMTTTARGLGLRVDAWVDERRDPVRATDAAVRFLNGLNDQFGSLYLAAAAYNGGPGRVSRGLRKYDDELAGISGDSLFFALADQDYLRAETKNYVPQLIAAAMIGKDPARYGVRVDTQPPFAFDTVRVPGGTPLAAIAAAAGHEVSAISALNPQILRGLTPAGSAMLVRVPEGAGAGLGERLAALDSATLAPWRTVTTRKGETAATFAARAGVPVSALGWFGPKPARASKTRLVAGQSVKVPTSAVLAAARGVPDPSIERYGPTPRGRRLHVVRRGESLGAIARRYGTTSKTLMRLNGLRKPVVYAGQSLLVRGGGGGKATAGKSSSVKKAPAKKASVKKASVKKPTAKKPPAKPAGGAARKQQGATSGSAAPSKTRRAKTQSVTPRPR